MMNKPIVQVAIGILLHQSKVLVGWREAKQHQGNKHEFPGGKLNQVKRLNKRVLVKCLKKLELAFNNGIALI